MNQFKQYQRKGLSEVRPYVPGEDLSKISVAAVDNPETDLGYVARNPKNHNDQWYIAKAYFEDNLEEAKPAVTSKRAFKTVEIGHHYQVPMYKVEDGKGIVETGEVLDLKFVRGSKLADQDVEKRDGTLHEHLLSVMISDLKFKMNLLPSKETACQITKLEECLHWAEERQTARDAAGVLGTYLPHKS